MGYRLGIDLGTTYTAAAVEEGGHAEAVPLGNHSPQVPSAVFVREDGQLLFGDAAVRRGAAQPDRLEREFKRRLGDRTPYVLGGQECTAEQLTAGLLRWVVDAVVRLQGRRPERIALTHPANWGVHRRRVFLDAVRLAGVGPVTTLTEPAAAAVHFSATERAEVGDVIAVYDLGGGTFDAAVMRKTATQFELLGTPEGIERLGGVDFDDLVFRHVCEAAGTVHDELDWEAPAVVSALVRLRRDCVEAKEALSSDAEHTVPVVVPGAPGTSVRLTRGEFEELIRADVERTVRCLRRSLESARTAPEDVRSVVLVGGSARIPLVTEALGRDLGRPVAVSPQPKLAVALGAALLAGGVLPAPAPPAAEPPRSRPPRSGPPDSGQPGAAPAGQAPVDARRRRTGSGRSAAGPERDRPAPRAGRVARADPPALAGAAGVLLAVAAVLALVVPGWSAPDPPAGVLVDGRPPVAGVVTVDLDREFALTGVGPAEVRLTAFGIPVGRSSGGSVDLRLGQLLAGPVTLTIDGQDGAVVVRPAGADLGDPIRWAPLLLTLFAVANAESVLRRVRRRRRAGRGEVAAMAGVGTVTGLALLVAAWAVAHLAVPGLLALAVLGCTTCAGALVAPLQARLTADRPAPVR